MIYVALISLILFAAIVVFIVTRKYRRFFAFEKNMRIARLHATAQESAARRQQGRNQLLSLVQNRVEDIKRTSGADRKYDVRKTARTLLSEARHPAEFALLVTSDSEQEINTWYMEVRKSVESLLPLNSPRKTCNRCGDKYLSDLSDPDSDELLCHWCELKPTADVEIEFRPDTPQRIRDLFIYAYKNPPAAEFRELQIQLSEDDLCHDDNPQTYSGIFLDSFGALRVTAAIRKVYSADREYKFAEKPCLIKQGFSLEERPVWLLNAWKRYKNVHGR